MKKEEFTDSPLHNMRMLGQWWPELMKTLARIEQRLAAIEKQRTKRPARRKAGA
jgi:hypothetical protein